MNFTWFKIFNLTEFTDADLVSRTLSLNLEGRGQETFLITKSETVAVLYDDAFLPISFLDANPYSRESYAIYLDADSQDVYFGFEVEE